MGIVAQHIQTALGLPDQIVRAYLDDLSDDELLVRPLPAMNHIAWQLGHLIASEHFHMTQLGVEMPPLPAGFAEAHGKQAAGDDDPSAFLTKREYVERMDEQRAGTLGALAGMSDAQLAAPSPEPIRYLGPTVGAVFAGESAHWLMHAGQWAVVRRKLGRPPLF